MHSMLWFDVCLCVSVTQKLCSLCEFEFDLDFLRNFGEFQTAFDFQTEICLAFLFFDGCAKFSCSYIF